MLAASEITGFVASALVLLTFAMKDMRLLRVTAICSNVAFIAYGALHALGPVLALHVLLLPINFFHLFRAGAAGFPKPTDAAAREARQQRHTGTTRETPRPAGFQIRSSARRIALLAVSLVCLAVGAGTLWGSAPSPTGQFAAMPLPQTAAIAPVRPAARADKELLGTRLDDPTPAAEPVPVVPPDAAVAKRSVAHAAPPPARPKTPAAGPTKRQHVSNADSDTWRIRKALRELDLSFDD